MNRNLYNQKYNQINCLKNEESNNIFSKCYKESDYPSYFSQIPQSDKKKLNFPINELLSSNTILRVKENINFTQFTIDLDKIIRVEDKRTTLMIKNIPNKYTINILFQEINLNYLGKYDFLYLPLDPSNKCNLGFAFINLLDPMQILLFIEHKKLFE